MPYRRSAARVAATVGLLLGAVACQTAGDPSEAVVRLAGEVCGKDMIATAVFVDDSRLLTNAHAVAGQQGGLTVVGGNGPVRVRVAGFDANRDLALLLADEPVGVGVEIVEPSEGEDGEILSRAEAASLRATGEDIYGEPGADRMAVAVNAEIGPGVSGAPMVTGDGAMIGLVFAESRRESRTYGVSAAEIRAFLDETMALGPDYEADTGHCP